jgi:hypothetical protein
VNHRNWQFGRGLCIVLAILTISGSFKGCSRGPRYELVPAKGVVTIDGQPVGDILVQFMPDIEKDGQGPSSQGTTANDGSFTLRTFAGEDGAALGNHVVTFIDTTRDEPPQGQEGKPSRVPPRYGTAIGGMRVLVEKDKPLQLNMNSR